MELADNKFKNLQQKGQWNSPSADEEKIIALEAEVQKLKKFTKKPPKAGGSPVNKFKDQKARPDWFSKPPKTEDLKKPKKWNNREWWYCCEKTGGKCTGNWRRHKPSECEGKAHQFSQTKRNDTAIADEGAKKAERKKLKLAQALQTIVDEEGSEQKNEE